MDDAAITYLLWQDPVGITRTRGIPSRDLERRAEAGLGWAMAGHALTPFEDIVDNPWGPMDEARQIPDLSTRFAIEGTEAHPAIAAVLCDSRAGFDAPWDCCVRTFCAEALGEFRTRTGLELVMAWEHEFTLSGDGIAPETPFSLAAARQRHAILVDIEAALSAAGVPVETVEPEYGLAQYEVSAGPEPALDAADHAVIAREVIREIARRHGLRASFTPKPAPEAVGNGAHLHFSFRDASGRNAAPCSDGPCGLSETAARFAAGILAHVDALVALTAPSPISYTRLGPHHWSCGFRAIGVQNREVTLRIVPGTARDPARAAAGFNLEYRPIDATASPYLAVGSVVRAGIEGLDGAHDLPPPAETDPAEMDDATRRAHGITPLPATLGAALDALESDATACGWFSENLLSTYVAIKRWEAAQAEADPDAAFARYARAY